MNFCTMLRRIREERQFSQKDVADYVGVTRQAIAAYETGKREPDYRILKQLADFFHVSVDFLLGRTECPEESSLTVRKNIELIKGTMSFKEFSEDISLKVGVFIFPKLIEDYIKGTKVPNTATLKVFAKYAGVSEEFFFKLNNKFLLKKEKELKDFDDSSRKFNISSFFSEKALSKFINDTKNQEYAKFFKELKESEMSLDEFRLMLNMFKKANQINNKTL